MQTSKNSTYKGASKMNADYINPFIEASQMVLKQIASIDTKLGKLYLKTSPFKSDNVIIIVGLTGKMRGQVAFSMSVCTAKMIASKMMMGMPVCEFDELARSAVSEMANMILGNTATLLYNRGIGIEITPPSLLMGDNMQVSNTSMKTVCIPLIIAEDEAIEIDVSLKE